MPKQTATALKGSYDLIFSSELFDEDIDINDASESGSFKGSTFVAAAREQNIAGPDVPKRFAKYVSLIEARMKAVLKPATNSFKVNDASMAAAFPFVAFPAGTSFDDDGNPVGDALASGAATVKMILNDGTGKREANPVITRIKNDLFPKPGPDLFAEILPAASRGDLNFYAFRPDGSERPEAERKVIRDQFWIIQRWLATAKGNQEWWIIMLNEYVNRAVTPLSGHPELIWKLMASCSMGRAENFRGTWLGAPRTSKYSNARQSLLARFQPGLKPYELDIVMRDMGEADLREWLAGAGATQKDIDDAFGKAAKGG